GVRTLGLAEDVAFLFVFQEKQAPYLVTVVELDHEALQIGAYLAREARQRYATCRRTGNWPGYADDAPVVVSLPSYYTQQYEGASLWPSSRTKPPRPSRCTRTHWPPTSRRPQAPTTR